MDKKPMYIQIHLPVSTRSYDKLMKSVTKEGPVTIKLDLDAPPQDWLYITLGQKRKIEKAFAEDKRDITLRFSHKQVKHNIKQGDFLAQILIDASSSLPSILTGLLIGSVESHSDGNGMFLGKHDHTYKIRHTGEELIITPVDHTKTRGFYVKHGDKVYQGKGLLHELFEKIPLLNILF